MDDLFYGKIDIGEDHMTLRSVSSLLAEDAPQKNEICSLNDVFKWKIGLHGTKGRTERKKAQQKDREANSKPVAIFLETRTSRIHSVTSPFLEGRAPKRFDPCFDLI